jgi:hypothetical protein
VQTAVAKPPAATYELGLSGFYSIAGGSAPGGRIELARFGREGWWGIRASAAYQSTKSLRVDIGKSRYNRALLGAALVLQWNSPRFFLSSDWGMVGSLIRAHGNGYSQNESDSGLNLALDAEARMGLRWRALRIWADAAFYRWLGKETIDVEPLPTGLPSTTALPRWDVQLGLGASVMLD